MRAYAFSMDSLRTLRRSTEVMNLLVLSTFEALGVVVLVLGIIRSSAILVTLGVAYAAYACGFKTGLQPCDGRT